MPCSVLWCILRDVFDGQLQFIGRGVDTSHVNYGTCTACDGATGTGMTSATYRADDGLERSRPCRLPGNIKRRRELIRDLGTPSAGLVQQAWSGTQSLTCQHQTESLTPGRAQRCRTPAFLVGQVLALPLAASMQMRADIGETGDAEDAWPVHALTIHRPSGPIEVSGRAA